MTAIDVPDPAREPSQPQGEPGSPPRRRFGSRRTKIVVLLLLAAALAAVITAIILELGGKTLPEVLPGIRRPPEVPGYSFSFYGAKRPLGVALNPSGDRIYVTESDGARLVRVYDGSGNEVGTLKPPKPKAAHVPVYVAVNPVTDEVYVSDRLQQTVYVYDAEGVYQKEFKPPDAAIGGGWQPLGLAFDEEGNLYVTDVSGPSHRVLVFRPDGTLLRKVGSAGEFSFPNGIAVDRWGNVYVSDSNNGRLAIFDPAGKPVASISQGAGSGDLGLPRGAAIDEEDHLYVVDTVGQQVQVYHLEQEGSTPPTYIGSFGQEGQIEGAFEYPNGIATDTHSHVYVTDRENNRVQVWSY